jgi:hypothetical protein
MNAQISQARNEQVAKRKQKAASGNVLTHLEKGSK